MMLLLRAYTWRKGNNYFYSQFTLEVHRNVAAGITQTGKQKRKEKERIMRRCFLKVTI